MSAEIRYFSGRRVQITVSWDPWAAYVRDRVDLVIRRTVERHISALDRDLKRIAAEVRLEVTE